MGEWKITRAGWKRPPLQLEHCDLHISFREDCVECSGALRLSVRESPAREVSLDARDLEILSVCEIREDGSCVPAEYSFDEAARKLRVALSREYSAGEKVRIGASVRFVPSGVKLEGIYRDTTPPGCPQQYISQCQQFGFQRIFPIVDDCTAKCTFRTTLEGDSRYTHLLSNGDPDPATNPSGRPVRVPGGKGRVSITYVNSQPMAPYLFFAAAGTWDVLRDKVVYPDSGRTVNLEYLVPPGRRDGARIPMKILKASVLHQHEYTGYTYPYSTYRTICMDKSLYGGMENTGNTTIVADAALIDGNVTDDRLYYAYGVIPHEYEHNHCGSGVTMETVFDMWLNEAYTVNVERDFLAREFGADFVRLRETDAMRAPRGPLAEEETGRFGRIVREGCNDPDEVVDGVTYVKAPEVLNTLEHIIGKDAYRAATRLYFSRYAGGNANTEQFLACFDETAGRDISGMMREWLFTAGYPRVTVRWKWDASSRTLRLAFFQTRTGKGGFFTVPVSYAAVDARGSDIPGGSGTFILSSDSGCIDIPGLAEEPAFVSFNRSCGFYGTLRDASATVETLVAQARLDGDLLNRADAFRALADMARTGALPAGRWAALYAGAFRAGAHPALLKISESPLDRSLRGDVRGNCAMRRRLLKAAAAEIGEKSLLAALAVCRAAESDAESRSADESPATGILRRARTSIVLDLLAAADTKAAHAALRGYLAASSNLTSRANALSAILESNAPDRLGILEKTGRSLRRTPGGRAAYLRACALNPHPEVFKLLEQEEKRRGFSLSHPTFSRALFCSFAANNSQLWTPRGLAWLEKAAMRWAEAGEYNTLRLVSPLEAFRSFPEDLGRRVRAVLERLRKAFPPSRFPALAGRLAALLD